MVRLGESSDVVFLASLYPLRPLQYLKTYSSLGILPATCVQSNAMKVL